MPELGSLDRCQAVACPASLRATATPAAPAAVASAAGLPSAQPALLGRPLRDPLSPRLPSPPRPPEGQQPPAQAGPRGRHAAAGHARRRAASRRPHAGTRGPRQEAAGMSLPALPDQFACSVGCAVLRAAGDLHSTHLRHGPLAAVHPMVRIAAVCLAAEIEDRGGSGGTPDAAAVARRWRCRSRPSASRPRARCSGTAGTGGAVRGGRPGACGPLPRAPAGDCLSPRQGC